MPKRTLLKIALNIQSASDLPSLEEVLGWVEKAYPALTEQQRKTGGKTQVSREWVAEEE